MEKVRNVLYAAATVIALLVVMIGDAAASPATPRNFRCTSYSSAQIDLAWDMAPPDTKTGKPMQYRLYFKGEKVADDLNVLSFTLKPSMVRGGVFQLNSPLDITLQSVDEFTRTAGNLPTTSTITQLEVWIQNPKTSSVVSFCKLIR